MRLLAALAEEGKYTNYISLPVTHSFTPVAIATSGEIGPKSQEFLKVLDSRVKRQTGEESAASFMKQRVSVTIQ